MEDGLLDDQRRLDSASQAARSAAIWGGSVDGACSLTLWEMT